MEHIIRPKIILYRKRTFSTKFSDTFDFIKENWKPLIKYLTYFMLPISLIQAANLNRFSSDMVKAASRDAYLYSMAINYLMLLLFAAIAGIASTAVVYTLMKIYNSREERLQRLSGFSEFWTILRSNLKRAAIGALAIVALLFAAIVVIIVMGLIHPALAAIPMLAALACAAPLTMIMPVYMFEEDCTLSEAVTKGMRYGFHTWGGIMAIVIVVSLIVNFMTGMLSMPYMIMNVLRQMFDSTISSDNSLSFAGSPLFTVILYISSIVYLFASYIGQSVITVAIAYQYGHAAEKLDNVAVAEGIDNFEDMGNSTDGNNGQTRMFEDIDNFEKL